MMLKKAASHCKIHRKLLLILAGWWFDSCVALQSLVSRRDLALFSPSLIPLWLWRQNNSVTFPLKFLPIGGCWAMKISIDDERLNGLSYLATIDTGSPFLTAPDSSKVLTMTTQFPSTFEQYGEFVGEMLWRKAVYVTLITEQGILLDHRNIVLGIPSSQVIEATGGIFVGLIWKDDNRPTFMQQYGFHSLCIDFVQNRLTLSHNHLVCPMDDTTNICLLYDLRPFGPDLYHYAVLCDGFEINYMDEDDTIQTMSIDINTLHRPVVAVLDTGLTGCILSDSFQKENAIPNPASICGACVFLRSIHGKSLKLSGNEQYWQLSSFRLPWFYDDDQHPHIIAMGNTFWKNTKSLSIDPGIGLVAIEI